MVGPNLRENRVECMVATGPHAKAYQNGTALLSGRDEGLTLRSPQLALVHGPQVALSRSGSPPVSI